jgi:DNA invertase Pin-like site-specific DNA recombinase
MKRAVLYVRAATNDHSGNNCIPRQLEICRKYTQEHGYEVAAELSEVGPGVGGESSEPLGLARLYVMAQAGEFDTLIARSPDRLSRNLGALLIIEEKLKDSGIHVEYVSVERSGQAAFIYNRVNSESQVTFPKRPLARRAARLHGSQAREVSDDIS